MTKEQKQRPRLTFVLESETYLESKKSSLIPSLAQTAPCRLVSKEWNAQAELPFHSEGAHK